MCTSARAFCARLIAIVFALAAVSSLALTEPPILVDGSAGDAQSNEGHSVSADGRYVVFSSFATNLVANDNNGAQDVFLWDTIDNAVTLVSRSSAGVAGNGDSSLAVISADGHWVAYLSVADNLATDSNGVVADVFLYNRLDETVELVSVSSAGAQSATAANNPDINASGRYVTFDAAGDLAAGASTEVLNVFRRDNWRNTTELISKTATGVAANDISFNAQVSADGTRIVFVSMASNLVSVATVGKDVFLFDTTTNQTSLLSLNAAGDPGNGTSYFPTISGNGKVAAFHSFADNLAVTSAPGSAGVFLRDIQSGELSLISTAPAATPANSDSIHPALDFTGNRVAYLSFASNLVNGDTQGRGDIMLFDGTTQVTTRLSQTDSGVGGNADSSSPAISLDGARTAWVSGASNLAINSTVFGDLLVADNPTGVTRTPALFAAVLPSSRSTQIGASLTVFASVIGTEIASGCRVLLDSTLDVDLSYQRTDPLSNAPVGAANREFLLLPGAAQSLLLTLQPNVALTGEELQFGVGCTSGAVPVVPGTNTLLVSAQGNQPPDVVALVATVNSDGILELSADETGGFFSVASINVGSGVDVTARVQVQGAALDAVSICQTNPLSGVCMATPGEAVSVRMNTGDTPTFAVFATNGAAVPFAPAVNRLVVLFEDTAGIVRGRTSVAFRSRP